MVSRKEQVMMMGGGLMVAIGFMFMGAASLSGLTPDGQPDRGQQEEINAELPDSTYSETAYGLGINEQSVLSFQNQVVFVNIIYEDERPELEFMRNIEEDFDGRVYINYQEASESTFLTQAQNAGIMPDQLEFPEIIVIGDQPTELGPFVNRAQADEDSVRETICNGMRDVGSAAALCF